MVVRKKKKIRKRRGRGSGYGSHKKHRGSGSRGGVGNAGLRKYKKSWMIKYDPEHFGRRGFKVPISAKKEIRAINLRDIDILAKKINKNEIDLSELGFDKVLSKGKITQPLTIKAKKFVEKAKNKIEEAGGKAIENV